MEKTIVFPALLSKSFGVASGDATPFLILWKLMVDWSNALTS
jgi:hypothetical protein